jgi:TP901 family phage tail tape measure protein
MSPDKQFELIADRLSRIPNTAQRAALAMEIFGKSGAMLTPLLSGGAKGIQDLRDEAAALGVTLSTDDAQAGAKLGDILDMVTTSIGGLRNAIGAALTPMLMEMGQTITNVISYVSKWIGENRALIATLGQWLASEWSRFRIERGCGAI